MIPYPSPIHQYLPHSRHLLPLADFIRQYGYAFIFLGTLVEGEFVLLSAGFLAYLGLLNIWWVLVFALAGAVIGDNLWYSVGRYGGTKLIRKYGKFFWLTKARIQKASSYFDQHGNKTIFISRFIFGTRIGSAALAGTFGMKYRRFVYSNILAAAVWVVITAFLGYFFGRSFNTLRHYVHGTEMALLILAIAAIIIVLLRFWITQKTP